MIAQAHKTDRGAADSNFHPRPLWQPPIWVGCDFAGWLRLLAHNRLRIYWLYWPVAAYLTVVALFNSLGRGLQRLIYGRALKRTQIDQAPIFIIGHWRTGTTLLHEFLALDERHAYPTTYECMEPNHFLLTEHLFTRWLPFFSPASRPMDNMAAGFARPQEDEFALCMLGQSSPYLTVAFPNQPDKYEEYFDLEKLSPRALASWKRTFAQFLKELTYKHKKRLILKSPTHSYRIKVLLEMFPDARFIHIVRNPYVVYPSTLNLWKSLYRAFALERPTLQGLEKLVLKNFVHLYNKVEEGKALVDFDRFYELHYEDLVRDPVGQMGALYDHLGLGGFEHLLPKLEKYLADNRGYETNRYRLSEEDAAKVAENWGDVVRAYGYERPVDTSRPNLVTDPTPRPASI